MASSVVDGRPFSMINEADSVCCLKADLVLLILKFNKINCLWRSQGLNSREIFQLLPYTGTANNNSNNKNNQLIHNTFYIWAPNQNCSLTFAVFSLKANLELKPLSLIHASCFPIVLAVIWGRKSSMLLTEIFKDFCFEAGEQMVILLKQASMSSFGFNSHKPLKMVLSWKCKTVSHWGTLASNSMGNTSLPKTAILGVDFWLAIWLCSFFSGLTDFGCLIINDNLLLNTEVLGWIQV